MKKIKEDKGRYVAECDEVRGQRKYRLSPSFFIYLLLSSCFLLSSCYYSQEDATLYEVGDNFVLSADSLHLQSSQPLHNLPIDTACEQLSIYRNNQLVVAETLVIPEDSVDSVWVKLARDQFTMGWVHQHDFVESVVPDDPISQFIYLFSIRHLGLFGILFAISLAALLYQVYSRKKPHVFFLRDNNISLTHEEKIYLATVNALFGSVWLTSDDLNSYDAAKIAEYRNLVHMRETATDVAVDEDTLAIRYKLDGKRYTVEYPHRYKVK